MVSLTGSFFLRYNPRELASIFLIGLRGLQLYLNNYDWVMIGQSLYYGFRGLGV